MLEYVFFHPVPFERFVEFLRAKGLDPQTGNDEESYEVSLPEDLDDVLAAEIEAQYDSLMDVNQALFESEQAISADNYQAAGIVLNLQNGQGTYAHVDPALLARIMSVLSVKEFGEVVDAIVDAVENPDARSFCQRMRDGDAPTGR